MRTAVPTTARVLAALRRYGWNATSFQILEPGFRYAFHERYPDVCVAYVDTGAAWVAAGAPIAPRELLAEVALWFVERAAASGRRASFFAAEDRLPACAGDSLRALRIGEQPVWDPREWQDVTRSSRSLREQLRRARAKGVRVRSVSPEELADPSSAGRRAVASLVERWLASRHMAPMGFLVAVETFAFASERRTYVAEIDGRAVAFLAAVPVYARNGWLFEDLVRAADAPNGTAELLVDVAMRDAAAAGDTYVTLGLAPLAGLVPRWMQLAGALGAALYDFRGVHTFRTKLRPRACDPVWLAHPRDVPAGVAVYDALAAFARGSVPRFALDSILRGPPLVMGALGGLLVPWTLALALVDDRRWFPAHAVKEAWVGFDVFVAVGFLLLAWRWRHRLAVALAVAVTCDALLTCTEALAYNARHVASAFDAVVVLVACAAPASATIVVWKALSRHRQLAAPT